jgi:N-acetylglucosamine malate deacetylase 1
MMRVAAVGAHPDDLEILCGGTLARFARDGAEVTMVVMTDGAAGHKEIGPTELRDIRCREAQQAAEVIGARLVWLALPDEFLFDDAQARLLLVEALRRAQPDLLLGHHPRDYHPDHRAASRLAFSASFLATLPNIVTESASLPLVPPLAYFDTLAGVGFSPQEYVDITRHLGEKLAAFECHRSQIDWIANHDSVDMGDLIRTLARLRGYQCGAEYAEGFIWEDSWPRRRPQRLLPDDGRTDNHPAGRE